MATVRRSSSRTVSTPICGTQNDASGSILASKREPIGLGLVVRRYSEVQCLCFLLAFNTCLLVCLTATRGMPGPPMGVVREVLAGGLAAALTEIVFYPADVVKVRLQTSDRSGKYASRGGGGIVGLAKSIWLEEGAAGLFTNGVVAGNCRALIYQGLRLGLFPSLKRALIVALPGSGGLGPRVLAGMATGGLGALLTSPLDLAKVRMMAQSRQAQQPTNGTTSSSSSNSKTNKQCVDGPVQKNVKYANSFDALFTIAREEGLVGGLWRASGTSVLRAVMASGAQLGAYDVAKAFALTAGIAGYHPAAASALASQAAAVAYTTAAAPVDLVKNRLMAQQLSDRSQEDKPTRFVTLRMIAGVVRSEGLWALWRGWVPATLSLMPVVAIVFPLMELLRSLMGVGAF
eukprot:CAMPEP_0171649592 /NCGR_PEP_ID=MMETSP0990-20121206/36944_1 /TAXON_ID=483369 /ORGANISM="non described non described, Strain CCMP2098" /LENGTH=402 /DNA_ID=CAMNT_0012227637 /DNA_START=91 /DNA_END=1299 /DNA_ORIENTATION=-